MANPILDPDSLVVDPHSLLVDPDSFVAKLPLVAVIPFVADLSWLWRQLLVAQPVRRLPILLFLQHLSIYSWLLPDLGLPKQPLRRRMRTNRQLPTRQRLD